eukprot:CAMPEP_0184484632 /NCGR_PEP_ID=MMETSP0113_2-20130426/6326_1 /TAXON_ID=91329 /ORGANISM="Norrisiella sphaerica, Strain BC52" /LENGTH=415 /DNA_ID=CAMNT_0026865709 /DNA_START=167 /DNA_END=1414 /DNA_ORIENTATION=+
MAVLNGTQNVATKGSKGASILVLKDARTGSTWLCEEMNQRGMHITQEALLNWERECPKFSDSCSEYFTTQGRLGWVTQSLLRPLPKTPYAFQGGCGKYSKKAMKKSKELVDMGLSVDKRAICPEALAADCSPPYTHESCTDLRGCFNQLPCQGGCYNAEAKEPSITGLSFNFLSKLGDRDIEGCVSKDLNCLSRQAELLKEAKEDAEKQGKEVLTLMQTRSNLLRWTISKVLRSHKNGLREENVEKILKFNSMTSFTVLDIDGLVSVTKKKVELMLQMSNQVAEDAQIMFYEDLARDVDGAIDAIKSSYKHGGDFSSAGKVYSHSTKNTVDQHPEGLEAYIENLDEFKEKTKTARPCLYRMADNKTAKDETIVLPLTKEDGAIKIDLSRDCCIADRNTYLRSVKDYVKAGLECSA